MVSIIGFDSVKPILHDNVMGRLGEVLVGPGRECIPVFLRKHDVVSYGLKECLC